MKFQTNIKSTALPYENKRLIYQTTQTFLKYASLSNLFQKEPTTGGQSILKKFVPQTQTFDLVW